MNKLIQNEQHEASELSGYPNGSLWLNPEYYHKDGRLKKQYEIWPRYTLDEIMTQIPENCMKVPSFKDN